MWKSAFLHLLKSRKDDVLMSKSNLTRFFKRLFQSQTPSSPMPPKAFPKVDQWKEMKARWEADREASSSEEVLNDLLQQRSKAMEDIQSSLEEALSLLDDAASEASEVLKVEITAIWTALDELVQKSFDSSN